MFCLSCKYIPESPIKECIDAITHFYPNEKILIADSYSDDTSYFEWFSDYKNVEIFENNQSRQVGALWEAYKRYPEESHYVFLQDTFILKKSLDEYLQSDDALISFMYFAEVVGHNSQQYQFIHQVLSQTAYTVPEASQVISCCFGPLFIAKNQILKNFDEKGLVESLKTKDVFEHQCAERIFGICAEQEGYPLHQYNIEGEYLSRHHEVVSGSIETFNKHFLMTKGLRLN